MKIISKFKDFYDGASAYGIDLSWIYERSQEEVIKNIIPKNQGWRNEDPLLWNHRKEWFNTGKETIYLNKKILGYCGKIFPLIIAEIRVNSNYQSSTIVFDNAIDYISFIKLHGQNENRWNDFFNIKKINEYFNANFSQLQSIFFEHRCPLFLYHKNEKHPKDLSKNLFITINPKLSDLQWQKRKSPTEVFQDIFQYISGVLGKVEKDPIQVSDKDRIKQHGFDPKYGFRTPPKLK